MESFYLSVDEITTSITNEEDWTGASDGARKLKHHSDKAESGVLRQMDSQIRTLRKQLTELGVKTGG